MRNALSQLKSMDRFERILFIAQLTAIAMILSGIFLAHSSTPTKKANFELIRDKAVTQPIHEGILGLKPVFIFRDNYWCCGTLLRNSKGEPRIITTAHLFRTNRPPAYYSYMSIIPDGQGARPIKSVSPLTTQVSANKSDLAVCIPGKAELVPGIIEINESDVNLAPSEWLEISDTKYLTSLVTGQRHKVLGATHGLQYGVNDDGQMLLMYLFAYAPLDGESGSGFISEDKKELVVLARRIEFDPTTEVYRRFISLSPNGAFALGHVIQIQ